MRRLAPNDAAEGEKAVVAVGCSHQFERQGNLESARHPYDIQIVGIGAGLSQRLHGRRKQTVDDEVVEP